MAEFLVGKVLKSICPVIDYLRQPRVRVRSALSLGTSVVSRNYKVSRTWNRTLFIGPGEVPLLPYRHIL